MKVSLAPRKRILRILVLVTLLIASTGIAALKLLSKPVSIGFILPLDTSMGNEDNLFARYYQELDPRIGLRPLKFLFENPASTEKDILAAYSRLDGLGVSAIVGGITSTEGTWLARASAESGIPTFGITPSSSLLSGKKDAFFRICPTNDTQAKAVASSFMEKGCERLLLVTAANNPAYVDPFAKTIRDHYNGTIEQIPYTSGEAVSLVVDRFKPDGLFCILPAKDLIQVINTAREHGARYLIGSSSWGTNEILSLYSGPRLDGVLFFSLGLERLDEEYNATIKKFEELYEVQATNSSYYLVSLLNMLHDAIEAVGSSRASLKVWFEEPRSYDTALGPLVMDEFGDSSTRRTVVLKTTEGVLKSIDVIEEQP